MYISNFPPSFKYEDHQTVFNHAVQEIIVDVLRKNKEKLVTVNEIKVLPFSKESYIVYTGEVSSDDVLYDKRNNTLNLPAFTRALALSLRSGGVFAFLNGINPLELANDLATHTGLSVSYIMDTYKANILALEDDCKDESGALLTRLIPKLYKLAIDTQQIKSDSDEDERLKGYCDCDFNIYTYHDKFMISCSASANMYLVEFNDKGFVVYGHSNSYGKEIEQEFDTEFEWDTAEYEPYYLKHLSHDMIIMEVIDGEVKVQNTLVDMLRSIVEFIADEEKINN